MVDRVKKDRISELPRNIQETILCFMPIRDAVRTSILSRDWRHCWTMIPHLIFDHDFVCSMRDKFGRYVETKLYPHKLVDVINKALLLHNGPILKFSLKFPSWSYYDAQIIHERVGQGILLFSRKGIKQLTLENSDLSVITAHDFSSLDLTHLRLANVRFPSTPEFGGFTYLTNLELVKAVNSGQSIFNCPVLEKLKLEYCKRLSPTNFHAPNLKCVYEISDKITLVGIESITEYSFCLSGYRTLPTKTSNVVEVLGSLHKIEKFSIRDFFIKYLAAGGSPNRLSKPLPYLKALNISHMNFTHLSEVNCLLCLIRSAPNLRKLHISANNRMDAVQSNLENYWVQDYEDYTINQLEIVTFSCFRGLKVELELVKFLLDCPLLKTIFIHSWDVSSTKVEEMLQYSRASSRAQIKHLEYPVDNDAF